MVDGLATQIKYGFIFDTVPLLRYCYDTPEIPEKLSAFVVLYAACEAKRLWEDGDFREFVKENREFSVAFIDRVVEDVDLE